MTIERQIIERFVGALNARDADAAGRMVTQDFELRLVCGRTLRGRAAVDWFCAQHGQVGDRRVSARVEEVRREGLASIHAVVLLREEDLATGALLGERRAPGVAALRAGRIAALDLTAAPRLTTTG